MRLIDADDQVTALVTVVIPCFNQARFLGSALASVKAQSYAHVETIVVDDGSTDETAEVALHLGAKLIRQTNRGLGVARTTGLRSARGEFVVFLDADDELLDDAIESGIAVLARDSDLSCVVRRCQKVDSRGRTIPSTHMTPDASDLYGEWLVHNFVWTPGAAMFRTVTLMEIGGFPSEPAPTADYAVYLELARAGRVVFDNRDAVRYRQHDSNMSRDSVLMLLSTLRVLKAERHKVPPSHRSAFREGQRAWRRFYGDRIVNQLRVDWRESRRGWAQMNAAWVLVRRCPDLVCRHLYRKAERLLRGMPPEDLQRS
jgi:glycosyltransferase involved in cell wall biosynthesis